MPRTPKTPQEKKRLSLQKDRRNTYGENDKGSRKTIPRSKARSHRKVRHQAKQMVERLNRVKEDKAEVLESTISKSRLQKGGWQKCADQPLGEVVQKRKLSRVWEIGAKKRRQAATQEGVRDRREELRREREAAEILRREQNTAVRHAKSLSKKF